MLYVTVHPEWMAPAVSRSLDAVAVLGASPAQALAAVALAADMAAPDADDETLPPGQALFWRLGDAAALPFAVVGPRAQRRRYRRKYAEGELTEDRSFWFRGPQGKLRLRARNLLEFLQIGEGVDDETWQHHLRAHDYSRWMRDFIKDPELGQDVARIEDEAALDAAESRRRVRATVQQRCTLPASG